MPLSLEEELAAFKSEVKDEPVEQPVSNQRYLTEEELKRKMGSSSTKPRYSADREMEELKSGITQEQIQASKLPSAILESMRQEPLDMPISDPRMDAFAKRIAEKTGKDPSKYGISRSAEIIQKIEGSSKTERQQVSEGRVQSSSSQPTIDYELIKNIVESAIDKRMSEISTRMLDESVSRDGGASALKVVQITEGGKFLVLDKNDNIYECTMTFKRKNKKK